MRTEIIQAEQSSVFIRFYRPVLLISEFCFMITLSIDILLIPQEGFTAPVIKTLLLIFFGLMLVLRNRLTSRHKEVVLIFLCAAVVMDMVFEPHNVSFCEYGSGLFWLNRGVLSFNFLIIAVSGIIRIYTDKNRALTKNSISGLGNTRWMTERVNGRINSGIEGGTLLLLDVRNFRIINAIFGRVYGDELIKTFAELLKPFGSENIDVGHLGGIEFCVWTNRTDREAIRQRFGYFESILRQKLSSDGEAANVFIKMSAAVYPEDGISFNELLASANIAMEQTIVNRQLSHAWFSPDMRTDLQTESIFIYELRRAIEERDFFICYQKKCSIDGGETVGLEALARWDSDVFGPVSPAVFVPLVQKAGLLDAFTEIIIERVFEELDAVSRLYGKGVLVAINIPPSTFSNSGFVALIRNKLALHGVNPSRLTFEITEDIFIDNVEEITLIIAQLNRLGIRLSLDDFGTGYSSLSYLCNLPVQEVKIDKSFLDEIDSDERTFTLVKAICDIAKSNDCTVVAEGVETVMQVEALARTSCDLIQGYIYSRPERLQLAAELS